MLLYADEDFPFPAVEELRQLGHEVGLQEDEGRHRFMSIITTGTVTNGVVVLESPLPEGAQVEIRLSDASLELSPELRDELAAWQQGSAEALALVERLADEEDAHEKR